MRRVPDIIDFDHEEAAAAIVRVSSHVGQRGEVLYVQLGDAALILRPGLAARLQSAIRGALAEGKAAICEGDG